VRFLRLLAGLVLGTVVGLAVIGLILLTKPPFLVNTPRSEHGPLLVILVAVPALIGAVVGFGLRAARPPH
jgi:hypothetical protein